MERFIVDINNSDKETIESILDENVDIITDSFKVEQISSFYKLVNDCNKKVNSLILKKESSYIYDKQELQEAEKVSKYCEKNNIELRIQLGKREVDIVDYKIFLESREKIEEFAEFVENLKIKENEKEVSLSTFEKYVLCHKFVSDRIYNKNLDDNFSSSDKNWAGVLSSDFVICQGYSSLLKCVCDRCFNENELKCFEQRLKAEGAESEDVEINHENNIIYIKDKKYGIDGLFYADACWDAKNQDDYSKFAFCLLPIKDARTYKFNKLKFNQSVIYDNFNEEHIRPNVDYPYDELESEVMEYFGFNNYSEENKKLKDLTIKKRKDFKANFEDYLEKYGLSDFVNKKMCSFHENQNFSLKEKIVSLRTEVWQNQFCNVSNEDLKTPKLAKKIKKYLEFYDKNADFLKQNEYDDIMWWVGKETFKQAKFKNESLLKNAHQEDSKFFQKQYDKILNPDSIPVEAYKQGFKAVAYYLGLEEKLVERYANMETNRLSKHRESFFDCYKQDQKNNE